MNTHKNVFIIGILLLTSGMIAALKSYEPSGMLQHIFVLTSFTVGIFAIITGKNTKGNFVQSNYYTWIGVVLIALSIALGIWATTLVAFINILGFFLLILGVVGFVFAWQILNYETPIPWKIFGVRLSLSALTATGAAWIVTTAGFDIYTALLALGILFVLTGLGFIHISRLTKGAHYRKH